MVLAIIHQTLNGFVTPDYSNYSRTDLEEALSSIDKEQFPERVKQIHQALAAIDASEDGSVSPDQEILLPEPEEETPEQMQRKVVKNFALTCGGLILAAMLLPVYFHSFLLNNEMVTPFKWTALLAALVVFVVTIKKMLHTNYLRKTNATLLARGKRPMTVDSPRRYIGVFGGALFLALFAAFTIYRGVPVAIHLYVLDSKEEALHATIAALPRRYRQKHCNGKIYLAEYEPQFFNYVCDASTRSQWEQLRPGQKILLYGSRSALGFLVK